ncbi:MAG: cyclic nucleotide-binding domain-containing protein, partial [Deltaproteobacteria bacterium]|nr:cyclic nucleotide-binding domain-containing protein [Deltaproteobacteria bacterium]
QYEELLERGAIDPHLARESIRDIENQMKALIRLPTRLAIPETARIVSELPLFRGLGEDDLDELASITKEDVFESGAELMREGEEGDCAFVIARGAVQVVKGDGKDEEILDVVGGGEIVGEMALLTGATRVATVRAATVVVVGRVSRDDLLRVVSERAGLRERVWQSFAAHNLDNFCRTDRRFRTMDYDARHAWIAAARVPTELGPGDTLVTGEAAYLYLVAGELEVDGTPHRAPQILEVAPTHRYDATTEARVVLLPEIPSS